MTPSLGDVLKLLKYIESGDGTSFFEHVADNVDWTVQGTHPSCVFANKQVVKVHAYLDSALVQK